MLQPQIEHAIRATFNVVYMELINESHMHSGPEPESHFKLVVVSPEFEGLAKVRRQQAVYRALNELMPQFHALGLHTYSPTEWLAVEQAPRSPKCTGGH
ncbi:BolA family protein [Thiomicrorhabdus aquaedulcis]|uniref:BolA family protein n=1 Tax=Thiomicrorhabdus aquaedulcis TaxID=2211106 RepID=UPI000FDBA056|nr:BolA family protein [Thiomicrorhabdus aquaedulcis]